MSSHHIVRENQEPALIVSSINELADEYIGQLLEWSPSIFTDEQTIEYFLLRDIKVDFFISQETPTVLGQKDIKIIREKKGIIIDSLDYLRGHNYKAVNIIASKVPDNLEEYSGEINIVFFINQRRYAYVSGSYEKWAVQGTKVYVDSNVIIATTGLKVIDENLLESVSDGFYSLSLMPDKYVLVGEDL